MSLQRNHLLTEIHPSPPPPPFPRLTEIASTSKYPREVHLFDCTGLLLQFIEYDA